MMCFRWPKLPCQLHIAMQIFPCSGPSEIQLPVTGFSSYLYTNNNNWHGAAIRSLWTSICCWYLDLLFQSNSFRLLFSLCSSVFLFLGYLLGRYLHFPLPIIVTFLSRALWCMCYLLRFRFHFYFLCFLPGLLYLVGTVIWYWELQKLICSPFSCLCVSLLLVWAVVWTIVCAL